MSCSGQRVVLTPGSVDAWAPEVAGLLLLVPLVEEGVGWDTLTGRPGMKDKTKDRHKWLGERERNYEESFSLLSPPTCVDAWPPNVSRAAVGWSLEFLECVCRKDGQNQYFSTMFETTISCIIFRVHL